MINVETIFAAYTYYRHHTIPDVEKLHGTEIGKIIYQRLYEHGVSGIITEDGKQTEYLDTPWFSSTKFWFANPEDEIAFVLKFSK